MEATRVDMVAKACAMDRLLLSNCFLPKWYVPDSLSCGPHWVKINAAKFPLESLMEHEKEQRDAVSTNQETGLDGL